MRCSFQDLSFFLNGTLLPLHLEYGVPACSLQISTIYKANSTISYKVGNWLWSTPLQRETAAAGPTFFAAVTTLGWPNYHLQAINGPFGN